MMCQLVKNWRVCVCNKIEQMESEDKRAEQLNQQIQEKMAMLKQKSKNSTRKKQPALLDQVNKHEPAGIQMETETKKTSKMKFQDLPEDVEFYLTEIYQHEKRLYMTGILNNGQALNLLINELPREIYFVLRDHSLTGQMSQAYLEKAENEIKSRLRRAGLSDNEFVGEMVLREYVFEIEDVPRGRRYYYRVIFRYNQQFKEQIEPTWEGQTYKYVIGTTYTPLELTIINNGIKGPCWITLQKNYLKENARDVANGLCVELDNTAKLELSDRKDYPAAKVLSFSLKAVIPAEVATKKYFPGDNKDQTHIYAISYHFCDSYKIDIKEEKPKVVHRTFYLPEFGDHPKPKQYIKCRSEEDMITAFMNDVIILDPDLIACHDASKILDTLVCRLPRLRRDRNAKMKFGRLNLVRDGNRSNQNQRINRFIAGRLLVDTYLHAKQMIKEIDYDLPTMVAHIKNCRKFCGISDEEAKVNLSTGKPLVVVNNCAQESEHTFNLMNHLEIIQTTRQLSNICGNLWKRSLENKRAERNEYLIMHECRDRDLIIPDKFKKLDDEEAEAKKKYQGGMVIEPTKGFKPDYILLLDFNSLYPSIIREYNVCFSKIERPKVSIDTYYRKKIKKDKVQIEDKTIAKKSDIRQQNPENDPLEQMFENVKNCKSQAEWGFLPQIIHMIVERRKKCKAMLKKAKNPSDKIILDVKQKCYKLVANSIYGCLGFSASRFYSRPLAALITKKGRDSLMAARDIVMKRGGVTVIYGDTDSLMIEAANLKGDEVSQVEKLKDLKRIADELKKQINNMYTFLEIDIDGIFKPMILLMKKKYVANKLLNFDEILAGRTSEPKFSLEYKGIEIVRRDGCKIARHTLEEVIKIIMRNDKSELQDRYEEIVEYISNLKQKLQKLPIEMFLFTKQLAKSIKQYSNIDNLPHVKVARDMVTAGEKQQTLINHTIYYVICKSKQEGKSKKLSQCAYDRKRYERSRSKISNEPPLELDYDYYKKMILEPLFRLLNDVDTEKVLRDRLKDAIDISTELYAEIEKFVEEDKGVSGERFGQIIGQSHKRKSKQMQLQLYQKSIICSCKTECPLVDTENTYTFNTHCRSCSKSISHAIYNSIWMKLKSYQIEYYNNKKRCRCNRVYNLTPLTACCGIDKNTNKKDQIAFKIHNFIYLCIEMCQFSLKMMRDGKISDKGGFVETKEQRTLESIIQMCEKVLSESEYENISNAMAELRLC